MSHKTAKTRYLKVFIPAMAGYLISLFGITWADSQGWLSPLGVSVLTLIPILCIFVWMSAQWRYVKELDEFLRKIQTESMMIGFMIVTAIAMGWGLMELMVDVPHIPIFYVGSGFYLIYGIAAIILHKRAGVKGMCL
ncbi:MAG TPA: hypothetical protein ENJ42_03660 [Hellea balneolensis]|uniref:DUF2178 domain-containing protein n=1 Tax=Hellea balneolensis TaxID=287478 RepID=A0A7C5LTU9_9PROT|nr:hypothetical protein [Hellea balneolensis]